jgi:hypothetical protein
MRIWLSTAPLAFRLKGAGGGTVDNRNQQQGLHLRNPKTCPNKPGHLSAALGSTSAAIVQSATGISSDCSVAPEARLESWADRWKTA